MLTAVYQLALRRMKLSQNSEAEKRTGTMTDPQEKMGARNPASKPWTWKSGMTRRVRSCEVSW